MAYPEYTALDLSSSCNAGADILPLADLPIGRQSFHGIPFQIGAPASGQGGHDRCFLQLARGEPPVVIDTADIVARHVLFAHRQLESRLWEGGPVGEVVAQYIIRYADGSSQKVPIRERFEIAVVTSTWDDWGQFPFLAVPDYPDRLPARYVGPWSEVGWRFRGVLQSLPHAYVLWAWSNPWPERPIRAIEVEPLGPPFLLAAITMGHLDEEPFCRAGTRVVKITLPQAADAARPFSLAVAVDRGVALFPYTLPAAPTSAFLDDPMRGYGEPENTASSPAYVEVAATPSATLSVSLGDETLGKLRWRDLVANGHAAPTSRLRVDVIDRGRNWVRTTVVDDATGAPIPCRIHFRSIHGVPYAPYGHHAQFLRQVDHGVDVGGDVRLGQATYAYIDGTCEGWLPRGDVVVDVARGFEYEPLRTVVRIEPGQQRLTLRLTRWCDMNARRYFSGDTHVHFLSTQGAHTEARAEGLNVINLLLSQWGQLFTGTEEFTGRPSVSPDGQTIVYASQENRQHILGHLTLLGLRQPVMPWCVDGPEETELGGTLETTLSYWADACHRQGGTVIIPHLPIPNGEPATLIATGRADAVEMLHFGLYQHHEYYRYLNCGYRLPLVGGTDKMTNEVPVGLYRTYVHIPVEEAFTYDSWCRNLRAGRTFLSSGPLIEFSVEGCPIGSTLTLPGNGGTVEVEATAESILPIHRLEIVQQGRVVAAAEERSGTRRLHLHTRLPIDSHTWLAARVGGPDYRQAVAHRDQARRGIMAHTSPIYIAVGGEWWLYDAEVATYMMTLMEGSLAYVRTRSRQHEPGTVTHAHGETDHQAFLERPFHEGLAALHARMHRRDGSIG